MTVHVGSTQGIVTKEQYFPYAVGKWLRHYATSQVRGSRPNEVNFSIYLILPATLGPGIYWASNRMSNRNRKIIVFLGSRMRPVRKADNHTAICKPTV
jgi:hypothetical protein